MNGSDELPPPRPALAFNALVTDLQSWAYTAPVDGAAELTDLTWTLDTFSQAGLHAA
jgi:hypothetical protein